MIRCSFGSLLLIIFVPILSGAATLHVPAEFPTIQAAIDAAVPNDTVLVTPGIYSGPGNKDLEFFGKDLVLLSETGPDETAIDCEGDGRGIIFRGGETPAAVIDGFTITNGFLPEGRNGAGIACTADSSPTIRNCILMNNVTESAGGGIFGFGLSSSISDCIITGNTAGNDGSHRGGGGLYFYNSSVTVSGCTVAGNTGPWGGGLRGYFAELTMVDCVVTGNEGTVGQGGGLSLLGSDSASTEAASTATNRRFTLSGASSGETAPAKATRSICSRVTRVSPAPSWTRRVSTASARPSTSMTICSRIPSSADLKIAFWPPTPEVSTG
jgi:hypothetical protein